MKATERKFLPDRSQEYRPKKEVKNSQRASNKESQNITIEMASAIRNETPDQEGQSAEKELLVAERRYCTTCGFDQPLRTKHCRDCDKCVAQYDHHCPWLGKYKHKELGIRIFRNLHWRKKSYIFLLVSSFPITATHLGSFSSTAACLYI